MLYEKLSSKLKSQLAKVPTPFIIQDLDMVADNYRNIKRILTPNSVFYAVKANKHAMLLKELARIGCGFEVNTVDEFVKVRRYCKDMHRVINSSPVKRIEDIAVMYEGGMMRFAFDSVDELDKLKQYAPRAQVYLRLHTSNKGSGQHLNTKYGVSFELAPLLIQAAIDRDLEPIGITFSVGSQCANLCNWDEGIEKAARLFNKYPMLKMLNLGGGLPVRYSSRVPSIKVISGKISTSVQKYFKHIPDIVIEPGRYLVANTALTATSVIGVKEHTNPYWIFVDVSIFGGFFELFEFEQGMLSYPMEVESTRNKVYYNVAGPTCDGSDIIQKGALLQRLIRGDRVYINNTGGYSLEYASTFNGFPAPKLFVIKGGELVP
ncbi:alanine racemase [candidate division WWE3 bacterium]|nr:alanine racemase [candidate division WWE3 bacterium]